MRNNIIYLICAACLVAACAEEQRFENINPTPGVEVAFSAITNESPETKTLYGTDADDKTGLKVKWVNGDKIKIYGTTCSVKEAEYSVQATTAATNTPNTDDGQNYADDLIKTGAAGVQWGSEGTSDFYAVYPSDGASFTQNSDGSVKINTTINATQNYLFNDEPTTIGDLSVWEGTHFGSDATDPSMLNAIMYAYTKGATPTDESGNTKQVDLHFKPFSTVFKFRFMGYTSEISNVTDPIVYVQSITITAPEGYNISGDFSLAIAGDGGKEVSATATATGNNSNSITLNTILGGGTYLPLQQNQAVDFNVFTIPLENLMLGGDITKKEVTNTDGTKKTYVTCAHPWKVTIKTQTHGTFEYTVIPNVEGITELAVGSTLPAKAYELNAGHIHKIKVPKLTLKTEFEWNPENWITQIPVPVYISELSMPGTWYSCHSDYQNTTDLTLQYKAGVRAFNLDCRITYETEGGEDVQTEGSDTWWTDNDDVYRPAEKYLVVAGTDGVGNAGANYDYGDLVVDKLKTIAAVIPNDEYVVVVLTIAEKPLTRNPFIGSTIVSGTVDPAQIIPAIKDIIDGNAKDSNGNVVTADTLKLYRNKVTSMTTIDDVKGHMIVKINTNNSGISNYTYPTNSLVSFASMAMSDWNSSGDNITDLASDYYTKMQTAIMHWGNAETDLNYYYHQAQRTTSGVNEYDTNGTLTGTDYSTTYQVTGVPTIQMRKDAIKNIISQSKAIYDNGAHNGWFQLGIGGYIKDNDYASPNQSDVATALNSYVQNLIEDKMDTDPSPVGIVLMNHACDASGNEIQLVKDIIEMNGKFYLNRVGGSITTGDGTNNSGNGTTTTETKNAAYAVVGDNAF